MSNKLVVADALALSLDVLATAYGAAAAGQDARATCTHDHATVAGGQCVRHGAILFRVPL